MKEIKTTNNYDLFKRLKGNRYIDSKRIDKIKKSIAKVGYLTSPILVNEKMEIIDGQGRFEALKQLQLPVDYIVQENIGLKECVSMNIYQTNWKLQDYIQSYADKGVQSYIYIQKIIDDYKIQNIAFVAIATLGRARFYPIETRDGLLEVSEEQYKNARYKLDFFKDIMEGYSDVQRINLLIQGLLFCTFIPAVNLERLKTKILNVLEVGKLPPIPTVDEAMQFIEEVYNRNSKIEFVYIYTEYRKQVAERLSKGIRKINEKKKLHKYFGEVEESNVEGE